MSRFFSRLALPVKVAVSCFAILFFLIYFKISFTAFPQPSHIPVAGVVRGSIPEPVLPWPSPNCLAGFYTKEELKPHLQRPLQDPKAPGANGKPFVSHRMTPEEHKEKLQGFRKNQFNQFASDRISLHRDLGKDTRHPDCLEQKFSRCPGLPTTSVIIVFHNEAWSTLLRTVYSVLHTAPAVVLTEVLLVDDASTDDALKTPLDNYVRQLKIVRVLRQRERKGLITARLLGVQAAKGEVLTFLDSHCECFPGWLEPLLARIAEQPTAVVSPYITVIDKDNLKFRKPIPVPHDYYRGVFDWSLHFRWELFPEEEKKKRKNETYPLRTPTFAGGLFSVSKSYFEHMGTYDDQMEYWGGENLEMSFRVWQCGGQLEIIPCSTVGHIFRNSSPHSFPKGKLAITRNLVRLAEVWMDDYKWVFYRGSKMAAFIFKKNLFGDVTERRKLRERLKCRTFSWFLNNVYPEAYTPDISPVRHGQLENIGWKCCLDAQKKNKRWEPVHMLKCSNKSGTQILGKVLPHITSNEGSQVDLNSFRDIQAKKYFEYTSQQEVRLSSGLKLCLHTTPGRALVSLGLCRLKGNLTSAAPEQVWIYTQANQLKNLASGKCLTVSGGRGIVTTCTSTRLSQQWIFI